MKCAIFGVSMVDYDLSDKGGQKGTSCKVALVKGRPLGGDGRCGMEAGVYKVEGVELAKHLFEAFGRFNGPFVADIDMDVRGQRELKQAVVIGSEVVGPFTDFRFNSGGLQAVSSLSAPKPGVLTTGGVAAGAR